MTDTTRDQLLLAMASGIEALLGRCSDAFGEQADTVQLEQLARASKEQVAQEAQDEQDNNQETP